MQGHARDQASRHHHCRHQPRREARASQNVAMATVLLDTLPTPSTDKVDMVCHYWRCILNVATKQR
jgi:hypothetical protein